MTTTIGFTINWWLVLGIIFGILFLFFLIANLLHPYMKKILPKDEVEMQSYKHELINSGRTEIVFFLVCLVCLMKYLNRINFNF